MIKLPAFRKKGTGKFVSHTIKNRCSLLFKLQAMKSALKEFINNQSLDKKLVFSYILIIFIPMFISNIVLVRKLNKSIQEYKSSTVQSSTEQISQNLNNKLNLYSQASDFLFFNSDINSLIYTRYTSAYDIFETYQILQNYFGIIINTNKEILKMFIYNSNDTLMADHVIINDVDSEIRNSYWYNEAIKNRGKSYYSNAFIDDNSKGKANTHFFFLRSLNCWIDEPIPSVLVIDIDEKYLYSLLEKEAEDKVIYIVNNSGNIISSSDRSSISKNIETIISASKLDSDKGTLYETINGKKYMVVYSTNSSGWNVISLVPLSNLNSIPEDLLALYLLLSTVCFTISLFLILVFTRLLTLRLKKLEGNIRCLETSNFSILEKISGNDEIGKIYNAFDDLIMRIKIYLQEIKDNELKIRNSEIKALQSQIYPHFLYNTIDTIYWLIIRNKNEKAAKMSMELSHFYKSVLSKGDNLTTVSSELDTVRNYLSIEKEKLDFEVADHYFIDEAYKDHRIIKFLLQPFVENVLNHAVYIDTKKINIVLRVQGNGDDIIISIIDDGVGISSSKLAEITNASSYSSGYAIYNIKERLRLYYQKDFLLNIYSKPGIGTKITIRIPRK